MIIFNTRNDLIKIIEKNKIICEIGVFKGEFSHCLLEETHPKELHLIDPFEGEMCSGDKDGNNIVWTNLEVEHNNLKEKYKNNDVVNIHKGFSQNILNNFNDNYFDVIYIDGDHSYNGVKNDLNISYTKVKEGGYICGHDYVSPRFDGVVRAVNEFCLEKDLEINFLTKDGCPTYCIKKTIK